MDNVKKFAVYMLRFRWVIDLTRWLISTGGTIAESAFLLATTYVIINLVAHKLMLWMLFGQTNLIDSANQIAMIAFSVLPELIVISAIAQSFAMWRMLVQTKRIDCLVWAILFSLPTIVFACITIYTITQFTSLESAGQVFVLDANSLHLRVISGWVYGVSQMLYAEMGKGSLDKLFDDLKQQIATTTLTVGSRDATIISLQNTIATYQSDIADLQNEIVNLRISNAQKKVASHKNTNAPQKSDDHSEEKTTPPQARTQESPQSASEKRKRLKEFMKRALINGEKLNIKKISAEAGVSYGTGLKHADTIIREITDEHPAVQLVREA